MDEPFTKEDFVRYLQNNEMENVGGCVSTFRQYYLYYSRGILLGYNYSGEFIVFISSNPTQSNIIRIKENYLPELSHGAYWVPKERIPEEIKKPVDKRYQEVVEKLRDKIKKYLADECDETEKKKQRLVRNWKT